MTTPWKTMTTASARVGSARDTLLRLGGMLTLRRRTAHTLACKAKALLHPVASWETHLLAVRERDHHI